MRWKNAKRSTNVEDRRGAPRRGRRVAGGGLTAIIVTLVAMYFGLDPQMVNALLGAYQNSAAQAPAAAQPVGSDEQAQFVSAVLGDTETTWGSIFNQSGEQYVNPRLVLFSSAVSSACGHAESAMGPFYCPADQKVYLDLNFFSELQGKYGAPGDFARAYVIAHEVGHHVQNLTGVSGQVQQMRRRVSTEQGNQLSVALELQADCYAGVWANHANTQRGLVEQGDFAEALAAASAVGDDTLQKQARGYVVSESFTHGSAQQRRYWFEVGYKTGDPMRCDTFS